MTGYHLMVEGKVGANHGGWELVALIRAIVSRQEGIGMKLLAGPECTDTPDHLIAWAIIAESHIVVSEWLDGRFMMDVFSCTEFQPTKPVDLAIERLGLQPGYVMRLLPRRGV